MNVKSRRIVYALLNLAGFFLVLTVNALANILPIAGRNTGEISDMFPNLFVPAGITFSIWGLIYLLLACFAVLQLIDAFAKDEGKAEYLDRIGLLFFFSSLANAGWILAWHNLLIGLSLLIMIMLFFLLLAIYLRLGSGVKFPVHLPFSVYLGWISIALIANVTAFLVNLGVPGFGLLPQAAAVAVIAVGAVLALLMLLKRKDSFYALVVVWAFAGIVIKRMEAPAGEGKAVLAAAAAAGVSILIGVVLNITHSNHKKY